MFETQKEVLLGVKRKAGEIYKLCEFGFFQVDKDSPCGQRKRFKIPEVEAQKETIKQLEETEIGQKRDIMFLEKIKTNFPAINPNSFEDVEDDRTNEMNSLVSQILQLQKETQESYDKKIILKKKLNGVMMKRFDALQNKWGSKTFGCSQCGEGYCHNVSRCIVLCECEKETQVCSECLYAKNECVYCKTPFKDIELVRRMYI